MTEESKKPGQAKEAPKRTSKAKRIYEKPALQYERVFETMALACGKVSAAQEQCRFNRKTS
jgi:hypothetical protein